MEGQSRCRLGERERDMYFSSSEQPSVAAKGEERQRE